MSESEVSGIVHLPVMLGEVLEWLAVREGGTYLDCTVGGGGHAEAILRRAGPGGRLIGLDRDGSALARAAANLAAYGERAILIKSDYRQLSAVLADLDIADVEGALFDLGVSSWQVLDPERGFSYNHDAPLDMRMDQEAVATAADLVNGLTERELAALVWRYGEERWAKRISSFIAAARAKQPVATTGQLVAIIKNAIPAGARRTGPHPAKRTFQALRIAVNDELNGLPRGLDAAMAALRPGGRIVVISFHSLEDRIVKNILRDRAAGKDILVGRDATAGRDAEGSGAVFQVLTRKPVRPAAAELEQNPRARSAKLRAAEKLRA